MKLPSLNLQILLGTIFGVAIGLYFNELGANHAVVKSGLYASGLVGTLFIDLLKMILIKSFPLSNSQTNKNTKLPKNHPA